MQKEWSGKSEEVAKKVMKMRGSSDVYKKSKTMLNGAKHKSMFPLISLPAVRDDEGTPPVFDETQRNITQGSLHVLKFASFSTEYKKISVGTISGGNVFGDIDIVSKHFKYSYSLINKTPGGRLFKVKSRALLELI